MRHKTTLLAVAAAIVLGTTGAGHAQLPPGVFPGERDFKLARAGAYSVDPTHTAVIAKVSHIGYARSVFRFDKVAGSLTWDPAKPAASSLKVTVDTASISTPVPGFGPELAGDGYLKSAAFPQASFVSTRFRRIDAVHGQVDGQFTLMGKTVPLTFDVSLIGAGKGFMGHPRLGIAATSAIDPRRFGLPALLGPAIMLQIDAEFAEG